MRREGTNLAMQMMAELLLSGNPQAQEPLSQMGIELTPEQAAAAGNVGRQNMLIPAPVQQEQPKGEQEEPVVFGGRFRNTPGDGTAAGWQERGYVAYAGPRKFPKRDL